MNRYIKQFKESEFLRNAGTLMSGTVFAQGISVFTAPVLYRIYDKVDYGTLGLYIAISGVIGVFSTMQYSAAILLEKNEEDAKQVIWLNRIINICVALLAGVIILLGADIIAHYLNNPNITMWLILVPISIFFGGQNAIFRVWANRKKEYKILTFNTILIAILIPCISIPVGLYNNGPLGLFLGLLSSHVIPPIILFFHFSKKDNLGFSILDITKVKQLSNKYIQFPKYTLPSEFINRFSNHLPVFMLSTFVGAETVGVYNLAVRMLGLPITFISSAIGEVFRQKASVDYNKYGNCKSFFIKTLKSLLLISILPFTILVIFGPDLFAIVFGEKWKQAGIFARILSIMFLANLITSPLTFLYFIANKQREDFILHIWMLISTIGAFLLGNYVWGTTNAILLCYSINFTIIYMIYLFRSYTFSKGQL